MVGNCHVNVRLTLIVIPIPIDDLPFQFLAAVLG
jgi:hypothetical protein